MVKESLDGHGHALLDARREELLLLQLSRFAQGKMPYWPVVKKSLLSRVWNEFSRSGRVSSESALAQMTFVWRDCCALLDVATNVAEHGPLSTQQYLERHIEQGLIAKDRLEAFVMWLIEDESGFWRISDFGLPKIEHAICLAIESSDLVKTVKYLDRALNVVHQRGDLSRLFVEGGRETVITNTVLPIDENDELIDGSLIRDELAALFRVHYQRGALIVAHPVVDGRPNVSADTTIRFWVDRNRIAAGASDRLDPVYYVAANAYAYLDVQRQAASARPPSYEAPVLNGITSDDMDQWFSDLDRAGFLLHPDNVSGRVTAEENPHVDDVVEKLVSLHGQAVYESAMRATQSHIEDCGPSPM